MTCLWLTCRQTSRKCQVGIGGRIVVPKNKPAMFHCHLNKGKNRYVAVWRVQDFTITIMEMHYVGTHEGANYKRLGRV